MKSFNGHDMEVAVRNMAQGAAWADDLAKVLKGMMHPAAANDTKSKVSAEMKEMRDKMVQLARGDNSGGTALQEWSHVAAGNKRREDDDESMRSFATTASKASTIHSSAERNVSTREIQEAKAKGATSLAIYFNGDKDMDVAKDEICRWARDLTKASVFGSLAAGEPQVKGHERDRRLEVALGRSQNKGPQIQEWLKERKYFEGGNRRMIFAWGQPELVVVVGGIAPDVMGVITVYNRVIGGKIICEAFSDPGSEAYADWFGKQLLDLINNKGDDAEELKEMLDGFARKEISHDMATWWIGPFKLSEWHIKPAHSRGKSKPSTLLTWAAKAKSSRINIVKSLVNDYNCSVTVTQKVNGKDMGVTALHEAAYCGDAAMVDFLLEAGANYNQESTLWDDRFPLDSAKSGLKIHKNDPKKVEQCNLIIAALTSLKANETSE